MEPDLDLALILYALHQDRNFVLNFFLTFKIIQSDQTNFDPEISHPAQINHTFRSNETNFDSANLHPANVNFHYLITSFQTKFLTIFNAAAEEKINFSQSIQDEPFNTKVIRQDYQTYLITAEYFLIQLAKGTSLDALLQSHPELFSNPDFQVCFTAAINLTKEFAIPLMKAGKIWWEHGNYKRLTLNLLMGQSGVLPDANKSANASETLIETKTEQKTVLPAKNPRVNPLQKFLLKILNNKADDSITKWIKYKVIYDEVAEEDISEIFTLITSMFSDFSRLELLILQALLNNEQLFTSYLQPNNPEALKKQLIVLVEKNKRAKLGSTTPEEKHEVTQEELSQLTSACAAFPQKMDLFLKRLTLEPAARSDLRAPSLAVMVVEHAKEWFAIEQFEKVKDCFNNLDLVNVLTLLVFQDPTFLDWVNQVGASEKMEAFCFYAGIQNINNLFAPQSAIHIKAVVKGEFVWRPVWLANKRLHKNQNPTHTYFTGETLSNFRRNLYAICQNKNHARLFNQFLFAHPDITATLYQNIKLLTDISKAWSLYCSKAVPPINEFFQFETARELFFFPREEKDTQQNNLQSPEPDPADQESVQATICSAAQKMREKNLDRFLNLVKKPQVNGERLTFSCLIYLAHLADPRTTFSEDDAFACEFRLLLKTHNAEKAFYKAMFGYSLCINKIINDQAGLFNVNSSSRVGNDLLFRIFLKEFPIFEDFFLHHTTAFKLAAETWNNYSAEKPKPAETKSLLSVVKEEDDYSEDELEEEQPQTSLRDAFAQNDTTEINNRYVWPDGYISQEETEAEQEETSPENCLPGEDFALPEVNQQPKKDYLSLSEDLGESLVDVPLYDNPAIPLSTFVRAASPTPTELPAETKSDFLTLPGTPPPQIKVR